MVSACAGLAMSGALAAEASNELSDLSLEQLSNVVVTSVSRQEERLAHAAASIAIISSSDIRRSGGRTLPEVLRLAPNLQVAHVDARNYAITARGFNSPFDNKLLVLIDGRSVYSPLFSGVFWDRPGPGHGRQASTASTTACARSSRWPAAVSRSATTAKAGCAASRCGAAGIRPTACT